MPFTFTEPNSPKAAKFLSDSAAHLESLTPVARGPWVKNRLAIAQGLPLGNGVTAFDKHIVITALMAWQDKCAVMA